MQIYRNIRGYKQWVHWESVSEMCNAGAHCGSSLPELSALGSPLVRYIIALRKSVGPKVFSEAGSRISHSQVPLPIVGRWGERVELIERILLDTELGKMTPTHTIHKAAELTVGEGSMGNELATHTPSNMIEAGAEFHRLGESEAMNLGTYGQYCAMGNKTIGKKLEESMKRARPGCVSPFNFKRKMVRGDEGDELDVDMIFSGESDMAWLGSVKRKMPSTLNLRLWIQTESGSSSSFFIRTLIGALVTEILEESGFGVHIILFTGSSGLYNNPTHSVGRDLRTCVVKAPNEPLSLPTLAAVLGDEASMAYGFYGSVSVTKGVAVAPWTVYHGGADSSRPRICSLEDLVVTGDLCGEELVPIEVNRIVKTFSMRTGLINCEDPDMIFELEELKKTMAKHGGEFTMTSL